MYNNFEGNHTDYFWAAGIGGIQFGDKSSNYYNLTKTEQATYNDADMVYTIFDTASNEVRISSLWYQSFLDVLVEKNGDMEFEMSGGDVMTECRTDFPDISLDVDSSLIKINSEDYLQDVSDAQDGSLCKMLIKPINAPFNVVGIPAYLDYYVRHQADGLMSWGVSLTGGAKGIPMNAPYDG